MSTTDASRRTAGADRSRHPLYSALFSLRRSRRDLPVGSAVFTALLVVEAHLGGRIGVAAGLTAVHVPLAMALMGLAVWLPLRAAHRG